MFALCGIIGLIERNQMSKNQPKLTKQLKRLTRNVLERDRLEKRYGRPILRACAEGDSLSETLYEQYLQCRKSQDDYASCVTILFTVAAALSVVGIFATELIFLPILPLIVGYYMLGEHNRMDGEARNLSLHIMALYDVPRTIEDRAGVLKRLEEYPVEIDDHIAYLDLYVEKDGPVKRGKNGSYKVFALQNKKDGHCIYDVTVHKSAYGAISCVGYSEYDKYSHGAKDNYIFCKDENEFMDKWGLK